MDNNGGAEQAGVDLIGLFLHVIYNLCKFLFNRFRQFFLHTYLDLFIKLFPVSYRSVIYSQILTVKLSHKLGKICNLQPVGLKILRNKVYRTGP